MGDSPPATYPPVVVFEYWANLNSQMALERANSPSTLPSTTTTMSFSRFPVKFYIHYEPYWDVNRIRYMAQAYVLFDLVGNKPAPYTPTKRTRGGIRVY